MTLESLVELASHDRWSAQRAIDWQHSHPWLVGCNFLPSCAINQMEMWQEETFSPETIDRELRWAASLGMNSLRVYLHDLPWKENPARFLQRIDHFLAIAQRHGIGVLLVIFDSCWNPTPYSGVQPAPTPGVHNSGWVQSPGAAILKTPGAFAQLQNYVTGVVEHFRDDARIHGWDVWNEPDNFNAGTRNPNELGPEKADIVLPLLAQTFAWARSARPSQPLTSGLWQGEWSDDQTLGSFNQLQVQASDVISFHAYRPPAESASRAEPLERFGRPLLCTEYLNRGSGNTIQAMLPWLKSKQIGAYNWGLVMGRSQTHLPWDSWKTPYTQEPTPWQHDLFRAVGTPYDPAEVEVFKRLTASS